MLRNRVDPSSQLALSAPEPRFWRSRATYVSLVRKRHKAKMRGCPSGVACLCLLRRVLRRVQISTQQGGILYLRVNERADRLNDNRGRISVKLRLAE